MMKVAYKVIAIFLAIVGAFFLGILACSIHMRDFIYVPGGRNSTF